MHIGKHTEREDGSDNSQGFLVAPGLHVLGIFQGLTGDLRVVIPQAVSATCRPERTSPLALAEK
jgi:hypothetical protein